MLVGDVIVAARRLMPDLPRTLPGPAGLFGGVVAVPGSTLPAGLYNVQLTFTNVWGETIGSNVIQLAVAANQGIQITAPLLSVNPAATGVRAYFAISGQLLNQFQASSVIPFTISTPGLPGTPPTRNTSFYPDSDGPMISAYTIFDWLNEALTNAAYICKGIPDVAGIQTVGGVGNYLVPGVWDKFENCWWDGFPVAFDGRSGAFYRNLLSGITFIAMLQRSAETQFFEFQPQPSRTGGATTLSAPIGLTDTSISLTAIGNIGLPLGMIQIGTGPNAEQAVYSSVNGAQLVGLVRGVGGTQQQAWPAGTAVSELNFRWGGLRLNSQTRYTPGQSLITLQVPPGWYSPLVDFMVGRFREAEQNAQGAKDSLQKFTSFLKQYTLGTKQAAGPRQVGASTPAGDGYPSASSGGRIIVP